MNSNDTPRAARSQPLPFGQAQGTQPMAVPAQNSLFDLGYVFKILRRWWWLIGLVTALCVGLTAISLMRTEPAYRSFVTMEVKQNERNVIDVSEVEQVSVDQQFLSTQIELLKSNALAERVIDQLQLTEDPYFFDADSEIWPTLTQAQKRRAVLGKFRSSRNVSPVGMSLLIRISFDHSRSQRAAEIANTMAETFINEGLNRKVNTTTFAREFVEQRLGEVRLSLEAAEQELADYAVTYGLALNDGSMNSGDGLDTLDSSALVTLSSELTRASVDRARAQTAYEQAQNSTFSSEILLSETIRRIDNELRDLRAEYDELLLTYKPGWPAMVDLRSNIIDLEQELQKQTDLIMFSRREALREEFEKARALERDLQRRVASLRSNVEDTRQKSIQYNILRRQVETERTDYDGLLQRLKEVSVSDDLGSDLVQISDRARPSSIPFKPNRKRAILIALVFGSLLGCAISYFLELLDDRVKSPDHVKNKLGRAILGVIPKTKVDDKMSLLSDSRSELSEAFASLRTNIQFAGAEGGPQVVQVTSSRSAEGKSMSSAGLALRFAAMGKRTLLIDADMRRPTFQPTRPNGRGLAGVLTDSPDMMAEIESTNYDNLDLLPGGYPVPNASELLGGDRFLRFIEMLRKHYDYVVIDSPPILGLADAPIIGARVDGTIMVVQSGLLRTGHVRGALERLESSGSKVLGVALSKFVRRRHGYGSYYHYDYKYGSDEPQTGFGKRKAAKSAAKRKISLSG